MGKGAAAASGRAAPEPVEGDSAFARALASSDYHTRAKGWKALQIWLQTRQELRLDEVMKMWRGILFCFWHSDKAHVQEELANQLAHIMFTLQFQIALVYFEGFLVTMAREWPSIDKLRLDKFMMLVRQFIRTAFTLLQEHKWDSRLTMQLSHKILTRSFIAQDAAKPIGFGLHLADLYISELQTCCEKLDAEKIPHEAALMLLQPFILTVQRSQQPTLITRIKVRVFEEFASLLEDGDSEEQQPFSLIKRKKLGEVLFASGAIEEVKGRNRHVLYELAELFDRKRKSKKRTWDSSEPVQTTGAATTAAKMPSETASGTPEPVTTTATAGKVPLSGSVSDSKRASGSDPPKKKKQKKKNGSANSTTDAVASGKQEVAQMSSEAVAAVPKKSRKAGTTSPASPGQQQAAQMVSEALTAVPKKSKKAGGSAAIPGKQELAQMSSEALAAVPKKSKKAGASPASPGDSKSAAEPMVFQGAACSDLDLSSGASAASSSDKKQKKRRKEKKGKSQQGGQAVHGDASSAGGSKKGGKVGDKRSKKAALTAGESRKLTDAVGKAVERCQQKRISFNLAKNLVHQIGKPLPAAELRTPPSSKPSGSALKKGTSVGVKPSAVARKLVF